MKNERSSQLLLFSLIAVICVLHAFKIREQRYSRSESESIKYLVHLTESLALPFNTNSIR